MKPNTRIHVTEEAEKVPQETSKQTKRRRNIFRCLKLALEEIEQIGEVVLVITFSQGEKAVCCYGHMIPPEHLFSKLNLPIGDIGISYRSVHRLVSWRKGNFVKLSEFEPGEDRFVALVEGITVVQPELVIPYHATAPFES
ncbi:MAG: hypothetical protein NT041_02515 [Candidatus Vogelbacteria bacterium]|nr:hypothetical protein [Candidatus Vogelbacteria bacterium]